MCRRDGIILKCNEGVDMYIGENEHRGSVLLRVTTEEQYICNIYKTVYSAGMRCQAATSAVLFCCTFCSRARAPVKFNLWHAGP